MFLRNAWYGALWSKDLQNKPLARTFLNEKVVLFRTESGKPVALEDQCCHRAAPLSFGEVVGECLQCGYHGLKFDVTGQCVEVPSQTRIPPEAKVRSYPVAERWKVLWIWMGDPALADPAEIPDIPWLDDPSWAITPGYIHVDCNYQFIVDNLLDVTHAAYVHKNTLAADPAERTIPTKTERLPDGVRVGRWLLDVVPPALFAKAGNFTGRVDRWQFVTWHPPATVYLDVGCAEKDTGAPEGDRSKGISIWSNHLITPETEETCHYLFSYARDFAVGDEEMSRMLYEGTKATFLEDAAILTAMQKNRVGGSLDGLIDINEDAAQLQARRMLDAMIGAERTGAAKAS